MKLRGLSVICCALVIGLLTGCGTGNGNEGSAGAKEIKAESPKNNEIAPKFHPTIEATEQNNSVNLNYRVKNISGETKTLTFPNGIKADYIVYDEAGKKVKQFSEDHLSTQAIEKISLKNNEELTKAFTISDLANGRYNVEVFLNAEEEEAKAVTELNVTNSFAQGAGTLNGQMDPHTIEVDMNGTPTAFQMTEKAIQQLPNYRDGDLISFHYRENETGQKTILSFVVQ
ncbi:BsuPI-related putative proteinase inhibitor [Neobacillus dielmonensis]|uniref:BsuPI-related putative proteinase inhibitor n=1 Tax=Neobacillus dielmonensis TaxID=1347369 RepID=UPI0005AB32FD|nr:BsuPI-related putative proteinase inhibitor [Neobacillus dielmonensis]